VIGEYYLITSLEYSQIPSYTGHILLATVETTGWPGPPEDLPDGKILIVDPNTFQILAEFTNHPSTAPTGITYDPTRYRIVTNGVEGGPRDRPWDGGQDYFYTHDPDDLQVTGQYTATSYSGGVTDVVFNASSDTYFAVSQGGANYLVELNPDDFSILNAYALPELENRAHGLTILESDSGELFFLVGYEYNQLVATPWSIIQIWQRVNHNLVLIDTVQAPADYLSGLGSVTWNEGACELMTYGPPWFTPTDFPPDEQVGFFVHNDDCNPLPAVLDLVSTWPRCLPRVYLPLILKSA
jgi:hypothetical protein